MSTFYFGLLVLHIEFKTVPILGPNIQVCNAWPLNIREGADCWTNCCISLYFVCAVLFLFLILCNYCTIDLVLPLYLNQNIWIFHLSKSYIEEKTENEGGSMNLKPFFCILTRLKLKGNILNWNRVRQNVKLKFLNLKIIQLRYDS